MTPRSRSHLYRAPTPVRPIASAIILAIWLGAALLCLATLFPPPAGEGSAAGASAAMLGRMLPLVAGGAVASALLVIGVELATRARYRNVRLALAVVLLLAGGIVSFGSGERDHMLYAADAADAPPTLADARAAHAPDIAWLAVALLAAAGGLATAVLAAHRGEHVR